MRGFRRIFSTLKIFIIPLLPFATVKDSSLLPVTYFRPISIEIRVHTLYAYIVYWTQCKSCSVKWNNKFIQVRLTR